jgi:hypothetical protein
VCGDCRKHNSHPPVATTSDTVTQLETAADPERLSAELPAEPPAGWQRSDSEGGIVEYRLPGDDGVCAAAKVMVRPDVIDETAVRVERKKGCQTAGRSRYENVEAAVEAVRDTLERALE